MVTDKEYLLDINIAYKRGKSKGKEDAIEEMIDIYNSNTDISVYDLIRQMQKGAEQCRIV